MAMKTENKHKLYIIIGLSLFIAGLVLFLCSGNNFELLKSIFWDDLSREALEAKFGTFTWQDHITVTCLAALQVICTFLPAEPVQVLGGLAFGFPVGLLCCMVGVLVGNTVIFLLYKVFGDKLHDLFVKKLHLDMEKIARSQKVVLIIFILYFLPAIPYGMICFLAAGTGMRYRRYVTVTLLGSLPSVCIGVGLGYMTVAFNRTISLCVFGALVILLIIMMLRRDVLFDKVNGFAEKKGSPAAKNTVHKPNGFVMGLLYHAIRFYYSLCGIRIKAANNVGTLQQPSMVLCNHGSFIDFIYATKLLKKQRPNFVAARLYFYDKTLGSMLRIVGAFPKSMFALDPSSTKNCIRVLKDGGILSMMPEARLSTTGRFEDIQPSTYSFIKKAGVPVYTIKFRGDYFADPKWGKGFRRGSVVEAELDILYTAEKVKALSVEEIQTGVENRLDYNEFQWLQERPEQRYRSRRLAEGLENILHRCPHCGGKHTITTKKNKVFCETCGYLTSLDDRYSFTGDFKFRDLTQWYDWQKDLLQQEIENDPNYALTDSVELRLPSKGKGLTRSAGHGICTLNREGLTYKGTKDGEEVCLHFPISQVYRLLFGAGKNFEIYNGSEILFFVPREARSNVDWYMASMLLHDLSH